MTSKTFNLNTFRLNIVGHPKTLNLNTLKAYRVKLMCKKKTEMFNMIVSKTMQVNNNVDTYKFFAGGFRARPLPGVLW